MGPLYKSILDQNLHTDAINLFKSLKKDSLFSATVLKNHFWDQNKNSESQPICKKTFSCKKLKLFFLKMVEFL